MSAKTNPWKVFHNVIGNDLVTRILLSGPPGTGKTSQAIRTTQNGVYSVTLHEESTASELIGHWIIQDHNMIWHDGPAIRAWKEGKTLVLNEIDRAGGSTLSVCYALLDDPEIAQLTLPSGITVKPSKGFKAIATMNGTIADLPLALVDRFDVKLTISEPTEAAINSLPEDLRSFTKNCYTQPKVAVTFREVAAYAKLRSIIGNEEALVVVFGDRANEVSIVLNIGNMQTKK